MSLPELKVESITRYPVQVGERVKGLIDKVIDRGDPWDRRKGESNRAYEAFIMYRDMGPDRQISVVRDIYPTTQNWSGKFEWRKRAERWDEHLRVLANKAFEQEKIEMAKRQARIGVKMQDLAEKTLNAGTVVPQSVGEIAKLVEVGTRVERMARGESTENNANVHVFKWDGNPPPWAPKEILGDTSGRDQTKAEAE